MIAWKASSKLPTIAYAWTTSVEITSSAWTLPFLVSWPYTSRAVSGCPARIHAYEGGKIAIVAIAQGGWSVELKVRGRDAKVIRWKNASSRHANPLISFDHKQTYVYKCFLALARCSHSLPASQKRG